jgi:2-aminoadipate transaminase
MSLATTPGIISFAGGMPGNDLFPIKEIDDIYRSLTTAEKQVAMQYGPTNGLPSLLESLNNYLKDKGLPVDKNRLMITTGSLQAINILAKAFVDPGDCILVENPSFIGALSAFRSYQANLIATPINANGIDIVQLKENIANAPQKPKFLYYCPNFHNPAGTVYTNETKRQLIDVLQEQDIPLLEDDVYSDLYFYEEDKENLQLIKMWNPEGIDVCYTGSFSKILGPGLRLGWMLVPEHIYQKCELIKQSIDACSPSFSQVIADKFLRNGLVEKYTSEVRLEYKKRALAMFDCLEKQLPSYVKWNKPHGGFYIWLQLPAGTDSTEILKKAIEKGTVFVTGKTFDPEGKRNDCMRISFCNSDVEAIKKGIPIVAEAIREVCG